MKHPNLNDCPECGNDEYDADRNGLTTKFTCSECGSFVGELVENTET